MQIKSLRLLSYRSWKVDDRVLSKEAKARESKIKLFNKLRAEGCSEATALEAIETKRSTFYRWLKALETQGRIGLEPKSRSPHHKRQANWDKGLIQHILALRKRYPLWGKLKLATILEREYGRKVSVSTVGRILNHLVKQNKVLPVRFYYGHTRQKKARSFHKHAKRWKHGMKAKQPGELIQIDHMKVYPSPGLQVIHFKATCPVTKITISQIYTRATSRCAEKFLEYIQTQFPYPILSIQVDGGSEFQKHFEDRCEQLNIPLFVLPPRSPEKNGQVERNNGTFKYEFYYTYQGPLTFEAMRKELKIYCDFYNTFRPHQALNQQTPMAYFQAQFQGGLLSHMY